MRVMFVSYSHTLTFVAAASVFIYDAGRDRVGEIQINVHAHLSSARIEQENKMCGLFMGAFKRAKYFSLEP